MHEALGSIPSTTERKVGEEGRREEKGKEGKRKKKQAFFMYTYRPGIQLSSGKQR
jgi:hypothetical protein